MHGIVTNTVRRSLGKSLIDEQLLQDAYSFFRVFHSVGLLLRDILNRLIDLMVVATRESLVTEEVNLFVLSQELQAVCLVPADWEHIK